MVWLSIVWIVTDQSRFYMIIIIGNVTFNIALDSTGIPNFVELEITYTEPAVKGDTSSGALKLATTENGVEIRVPIFVNQGDKVKVDTRTGEYVERVK